MRTALRAQVDQLLTTAAIFIGSDVIRVAMNRWIQHFEKPCHEPLTTSDHVQSAFALMFFQGLL
jgi:hypothetical protein